MPLVVHNDVILVVEKIEESIVAPIVAPAVLEVVPLVQQLVEEVLPEEYFISHTQMNIHAPSRVAPSLWRSIMVHFRTGCLDSNGHYPLGKH